MKKLIFIFGLLLIGVGFISTPDATAAPAPYTGGAAVVKVLHPSDGSTVTITATGAVIKQSSGHSAYREGWIDPANICNINIASDLRGQLQPGSSNPFGTGSQSQTGCNVTPSNNSSANMNNNVGNSVGATANNSFNSSASSNATSNATATANVITAGSQPSTVTQPATSSSTSVQTSSEPQVQTTAASSGKGATTLPNTGPGAIVPAFGISTVLGTAGHYLFNRRRLK